MRANRHYLTLLLVLFTSLSPATVQAQVSAADRGAARQLVVAGMDALEKKDFAVAVDRFERANAILFAPTIALGLGRARLGIGKLVMAQDAFSRAANTPIGPDTSPAFREAIEAAARELANLTPRVPSVVIEIHGPTSAQVRLDDAEVPSVSLGVARPADPGQHVIRAKAAGFAPAELSVTLREGQAEKVVLELKPIPGGDAAAPPEKPTSPGGKTAPAAETPKSNAPTPPKSGFRRTAAWGAIGLGAAGVAVGSIFGGIAAGNKSTLSSECPNNFCATQQAKNDLSSANTNAAVSTIGLSVGAVALAGGVVLLLLPESSSHRDDAPKAARVIPTIGPQGGGLSVVGSF